MGRRIPSSSSSSFMIALAIEEGEWNKPFRNAFDRSDRKKFLMRYSLIFLGFISLSLLSHAVQPVRISIQYLSQIPTYSNTSAESGQTYGMSGSCPNFNTKDFE
jgi:hypothetical protein